MSLNWLPLVVNHHMVLHSFCYCITHLLFCACFHRHCHYFQEVVELREGDEIAVSECAYGGEEGDRSWRDQLHIENRLVEFDTRIGHLSFIVLHQGMDGGDQGVGQVTN